MFKLIENVNFLFEGIEIIKVTNSTKFDTLEVNYQILIKRMVQ